jgi:hypothetical protein
MEREVLRPRLRWQISMVTAGKTSRCRIFLPATYQFYWATATPHSHPREPTQPVIFPVVLPPQTFNGDNRQDLAVANFNSNDMSVLLGNGDSTFQPAVNYAVGSNPQSVIARDFNGDNDIDLATANLSSGDVSVLLGKGDGTFEASANFLAGINPNSVTADDFDGDGKLDLAVRILVQTSY